MAEKKKTDRERIEVIALPPLKMVLVHAKDERENKKSKTKPNVKQNTEDEQVQPQALKRLIKHLEKED